MLRSEDHAYSWQEGEPVADTGEAVNDGAQPIRNARLMIVARRACANISHPRRIASPPPQILIFEQLFQFLLAILEW